MAKVTLDFYHRDKLNRIIKEGDVVAHSIPRQGYGLSLIRVTRYTAQQLHGECIETGKRRRFFPDNAVVITQQIQANIDGQVGGAEAELPVIELPEDSPHTARGFFERMGISSEEIEQAIDDHREDV